MKPIQMTRKRVAGVAIAVVVAVLIAACGGGDRDSAATAGREQAQGAGSGNAISWAPTAVAFPINPGGRQDIPVTLTASAAIPSATITVVPELQSVVSVNPTSIGALRAGQSVTVTLSVAPSATVALGTLNGTVRLVVGTATLAKPLPVSLTLVAPQIINGVTVPPEPPADLNNATLAGFDANANGVRDDVERLIASRFGTDSARVAFTTTVARAMQSMLISPSVEAYSAYSNTIRCVFDRNVLIDAIAVERSMLTTGARKGLYGDLTAGSAIDINEEGC